MFKSPEHQASTEWKRKYQHRLNNSKKQGLRSSLDHIKLACGALSVCFSVKT